ncbi:heterokaryon incompatibility, partial [Patellaria atrata CBS 101060]
ARSAIREYIYLSYCCGLSPEVTTNTKSFASRKAQIQVSALPKTYRDAVIITRALEKRWLFIDALCILQDADNSSEWERESCKMSHIFKHAYITICTSAGNDKNSGCFPGVAHLRGESLTLDMLSPGQGVWRVTLSENSSRLFGTLFGPLSKRRWCLQERILSTRLLHCGYERLVFKCN